MEIVNGVIIEDAKNKGEILEKNKVQKMSNYAYDEFCKPICWQKYENCDFILAELKKRLNKIGIISNFDERIYSILKNLEIYGYFDFIVIPSNSRGAMKPQQEIFNQGLKTSGLRDPSLITHIGNDIELDYDAAQNAGFKSILIYHDKFDVNDLRLTQIIKKGNYAQNLKNILKILP